MKNYIVSGAVFGVIAVIVVAIGFAVIKPTVVVDNKAIVDQALGSASSPSVVGGCMEVDGLTTCVKTQAATIASTSCAALSPSATSTVKYWFRVSSSTPALVIESGKAANPFSTTTLISRHTVSAGVQATITSSTTPTGAQGIDDVYTIAPNTWVTIKSGGIPPAGKCAFEFKTF